MKKVVFGSALMLCGMIGSAGWMIVDAIGGWWSNLDEIFALSYFIVSVVGMIIAITGLKKDK